MTTKNPYPLNVEDQFQLFLQRAITNSDEVDPEYIMWLRHTFYGAWGTVLMQGRDTISQMSEEQACEVLQNQLDEVQEYLIQQMALHE